MHPVQAAVRHRQEPDHLRQGAAEGSDRICRRGRGHHASRLAAAAQPDRRRECRHRLRPRRPAAGPGHRPDGAARGQGRPRVSRPAEPRVRRGDRPARRAHLRKRLRPVHHRLAAAARRSALRPARAERRPQGQERHLLDRRQRARAACRRRASNARGWCSNGASCRSSSPPTPTRCRARSIPETGRVHTSFSLAGAQTGRLSSNDPELAEHPDPHRDRPQDPRRLRRRAGPCADERRL